MVDKLKILLEGVLALDESERAIVAATLLESLEPEADSGVEEGWEQEILQRLNDIDSGKVKTIPWTEARKAILEGR